ncbi:SpoVAC/SpoVAEB sporulation membrane protein [Natranaerofaba carboxydovora]|nr:SpoVAC/SpoVAEB sporulation membrane protein [Natranaerofaba carboxydovora]
MIRGVFQIGTYLTAFLVGGLFCIIGQLLFDLTKLTPAHILVLFVIAGGVLSGVGLYEPIVQFAGAGATIPIASFGNSLVQGAMYEASQTGIIGVLTGMFEVTSTGITAAIIFAFVMALIFDPKGLN